MSEYSENRKTTSLPQKSQDEEIEPSEKLNKRERETDRRNFLSLIHVSPCHLLSDKTHSSTSLFYPYIFDTTNFFHLSNRVKSYFNYFLPKRVLYSVWRVKPRTALITSIINPKKRRRKNQTSHLLLHFTKSYPSLLSSSSSSCYF